ncbi:Ras-interacting protein [Trichinella pseudospiralis]
MVEVLLLEQKPNGVRLVLNVETLWVRLRRGSLRNGYHIQGRQQARKLPTPSLGRTKVRGSKAIRYRPSSNGKLCQPAIRRSSFKTRRAASGKPKCFGSGGSMVAKLKLKGIDGRAPPGVEPAA